MGENLTLEAFKFMILGMGIVFIFLSILILLLNIQTNLIKRFSLSPKSVRKRTPSLKQSETANNQTREDEEIIAAITAAVQKFRKRKLKT